LPADERADDLVHRETRVVTADHALDARATTRDPDGHALEVVEP